MAPHRDMTTIKLMFDNGRCCLNLIKGDNSCIESINVFHCHFKAQRGLMRKPDVTDKTNLLIMIFNINPNPIS